MHQKSLKTEHRTDNSKIISLEKGKIPPQAIDLEEAIIGGLLNDKNAINEVFEIIGDRSDIFYKESHKHIYDAILDIYQNDIGVDLLTVSDSLKKRGYLDLIGGEFELISLGQRISSTAHIEFHCRIVLQKFVQRDTIRIASEMTDNAYSEDVDIFDLLDDSQRLMDETSTFLNKKKPETLKSIGEKFKKMGEVTTVSIPSKLSKLNAKVGGYHPSDLTIIAARPGMGKTAFILNEMKHQAKQGIAVGFLSLEMSSVQILGRFLAEEFEIDSGMIKQNKHSISEKAVIKQEMHKVTDLPIHIRDEGGIAINDAKNTIGKWVRQEKVKIVYIDYLQLMTTGGSKKYGTREQEISYISGRLKSIAKEFEIPIVALSQLSRAVETRGGSKRPLLSDLRESGAIEQDADSVWFLYRPAYYKIDEWEDGSSTENQCEIDIQKIREGEIGPTLVGCKLKYMRFQDLEDEWNEPLPEPNQNVQEAFEIEPSTNPNVNKDEDEDDLPF